MDNDSLPSDWLPLFVNANDHSNEGIIHVSKYVRLSCLYPESNLYFASYLRPFFSVQFHPEAAAGPTDANYLFKTFLDIVRGAVQTRSLLDPMLYQKKVYRKVLLVGSGGLSIGQVMS